MELVLKKDAAELKEHILVVPSNVLPISTRVIPYGQEKIFDLITKYGEYRLRNEELENDDSVRQIIPYITLKHEGKHLLLQRTNKGGEQRLHGEMLVGLGGHCNAEDIEGKELMSWGERELAEEAEVKANIISTEYAGIISSNAGVDAFHLGLLIVITIDSKEVRILEEDKLEIKGWYPIKELSNMNTIEGWSQKVIKHLSKAT